MREPNVFLLDEPLSNLDAKLRVQTRAEISKLHKQLETTFIYVTHDQTEAMTMADRIAVMKLGILNQVDSPQNLYDLPVNKFVAGFIGSPSMNFFDGMLTDNGHNIFFDGGSFQLQIPDKKKDVYKPHVGKPVTFGIRPEDIHNPDFQPQGIIPAVVDAKVEVTELMGNEIFVYLNTGDHSGYIARVDPRSKYQFGQSVKVAFNMDNFHIFDKETEEAIR